MAIHLVTVEIPLEVDYTSTKKNAVCKVYFSGNTATRMECFIDGRHFTPKSIDDDLAIVAKAKEMYKGGTGKFINAADETDKLVKDRNIKVYSDSHENNKLKAAHQVKAISAPSAALEPKPKIEIKTEPVELSKFDVIKNYIISNNGKITIKDVIEKLDVSDSSVKNALIKLKAVKVRDMNYKWKGRRFFISIP
jgi:hypothetical protein